MPKQFSTTVRSALADAYESTIGASPTLEIRTGAAPANCAAADSGSVIVAIALPADWLTNPGSGSKAINGTWQANATLAGTNVAAHYRIKQGATCHEQGTVTVSGGGGDLELQNTSIAQGQTVTITAWNLTIGGA